MSVDGGAGYWNKYVINCDGRDNGARCWRYTGGYTTAYAARRGARRHGWAVQLPPNGLDLCPGCAVKAGIILPRTVQP